MMNGTYEVKHKLLGTERKLIAFNGSLKMYNNGKYVCLIDEHEFNEYYHVVKKLEKQDYLWKIVYMVKGKITHEWQVNASYAVCQWKKKELMDKGYVDGLLLICRSDLS